MPPAGKARSLVVCAVILALLAVATAPAWHRHHEESHVAAKCGHSHSHSCGNDLPDDRRNPDQDRHDDLDCPVCIAIYTPTGSGLPGGAAIVLTLIQIDRTQAQLYDEPVVRFLPVLWSCGPPSPLA
ncbi:MAG: hypothetical protein LW822_06575 [Phycisphaeraceae bacterium]|nr:hypothetical protein [Phycisphaeraceae bacterium]